MLHDSTTKTALGQWFADLLRGPVVRDDTYFERLAATTAASAPAAKPASCGSCA